MKEQPNIGSQLLHLGCGLEAPSAWLNVDGSFQASFARKPHLKRFLVSLGIYPRAQAAIAWPTNVMRLDLRKPLPFASGRFQAIYSSHTFEHLYRDKAVALSRECFRVLQPGGFCRIVVPDLAAAVERYQMRLGDPAAVSSAADQFLDELMLQPRAPAGGLLGSYHRFMNVHQHKWMYDRQSLCSLLEGAGFTNLMVYTSVKGDLPGLREIEKPSRIENGAGIAVEGRK